MSDSNKKETHLENSEQGINKTRRNVLLGTAAAGAAMVSSAASAGGSRMFSGGNFDERVDAFCEQRNRPLEGKTAFITGGARGIGRGCAEVLAEQGANIVIFDVAQQIETVKYPLATPEDMSETQALVEQFGVECVVVQGDVRNREALSQAMQTAVDRFGSLDFVMANAGITQIGMLDTFTDAEVSTVIDVNLGGVIKTIQAATPILREQQSGRIVLTSSVTGRGGSGLFPVYSATKWAVIGLAKATAQSLGPFNVTCNAICPDIVHTPLLDNDYILQSMGIPDFETFAAGAENLHPLPIGAFEPRDVGKTVKYLCSDDAKYVTAEVFDISAGANASHMA